MLSKEIQTNSDLKLKSKECQTMKIDFIEEKFQNSENFNLLINSESTYKKINIEKNNVHFNEKSITNENSSQNLSPTNKYNPISKFKSLLKKFNFNYQK